MFQVCSDAVLPLDIVFNFKVIRSATISFMLKYDPFSFHFSKFHHSKKHYKHSYNQSSLFQTIPYAVPDINLPLFQLDVNPTTLLQNTIIPYRLSSKLNDGSIHCSLNIGLKELDLNRPFSKAT
jgi:hypothetical protein